MALALTVAAPIAAVLCAPVVPSTVFGRVRVPRGWGPAAAAVAVVVPLLTLAVALRGPLRSRADATVLVQTRATADYARAGGVTFLSGYYWDMWPTQWEGLKSGRNALFVTGLKSGGDPEGYRDAFREELAKGPGHPRAMCVNQPASVCTPYLDYWTAPGWITTAETCPIPADIEALGSPPPERSCRVLEYRGAGR